ncbi:hypothetical protein ACFCYN_10955 [Gottfriedia sp. NPDC056225]|uniref:hypothetical protein n=1 Tax=Gottfriedia sp. NPDC056225 TaxID=3345751 RepID=UPI00155995F4|nr:hypothetical protein HPK19_20925 [Arthrobacter citreus]
MEELTLMEWCSEQGFKEEDIEFITDFMTFMSMSKYGKRVSYEKVIKKLDGEFPQYKLDATKDYLNFSQFNELIKNNINENIDTSELLHRFCNQNLCEPLATYILLTSN